MSREQMLIALTHAYAAIQWPGYHGGNHPMYPDPEPIARAAFEAKDASLSWQEHFDALLAQTKIRPASSYGK